MNVTLDYQPNCVVALEIDLPSDRVSKERDSVFKKFQKNGRLPGYRPGKAPEALIASRYAKEIEENIKDNLVHDAIGEAVKSHNLDLQSISVADVVIAPDQTMKIRASGIHAPIFDLPDYKNIAIEVAKKVVTEDDVTSFIEYLRNSHTKFDVITGRAAAMGDYAVVSYEGTVDGLPLTEIAPKSPVQLQSRRNAWVLLDEGTLFPGFAAAITGMEPGQERTFTLTVPETFPAPELVGRQVTYTLTLHAINSRTLPPVDDELAAKIEPGQTLETLRQKIREQQEDSHDYEFTIAKRNAVASQLLDLFTCELPEKLVASETASILENIVSSSQARGISDEEIKSNTDKIVQTAEKSARTRVRSQFLFLRIAEKESLEVSDTELYRAVLEMAEQTKTPVKKLVGDLQRSGSIRHLRDQILIAKAIDLVTDSATVTEPATAPVAQA
jgi:trigger factor